MFILKLLDIFPFIVLRISSPEIWKSIKDAQWNLSSLWCFQMLIQTIRWQNVLIVNCHLQLVSAYRQRPTKPCQFQNSWTFVVERSRWSCGDLVNSRYTPRHNRCQCVTSFTQRLFKKRISQWHGLSAALKTF